MQSLGIHWTNLAISQQIPTTKTIQLNGNYKLSLLYYKEPGFFLGYLYAF